MALQTSTPRRAGPRLGGARHQRRSAAWPWTRPRQANSGHSGTAMALAPLAHVLWTRIMHHDPRDPEWPDRDRFVLSNGHACILQYAMLHLTGYDLSLEDLRQFRQWGSRTPGHPEAGHTAGIEVTTGPLGQGVGNAVGMAIAERWLRTTLRQRGLRPPHLRHRRRRLLHGGHLARGGVAGRAPRPGPPARLLRRQPHHHRRADRAGLQRRRARALRGLRLARAQPRRDGQRRRRAGGRHPRGARRAGGRARRQADPARAAQPHRLALARS